MGKRLPPTAEGAAWLVGVDAWADAVASAGLPKAENRLPPVAGFVLPMLPNSGVEPEAGVGLAAILPNKPPGAGVLDAAIPPSEKPPLAGVGAAAGVVPPKRLAAGAAAVVLGPVDVAGVLPALRKLNPDVEDDVGADVAGVEPKRDPRDDVLCGAACAASD